MSYDCTLGCPCCGRSYVLDAPHEFRGGTYALGQLYETDLNITYNYGGRVFQVMGKSINDLDGMTGLESLPLLRKAVEALGDDVDPDYWQSSDGNVKAALKGLLCFAEAHPEGVWKIT